MDMREGPLRQQGLSSPFGYLRLISGDDLLCFILLFAYRQSLARPPTQDPLWFAVRQGQQLAQLVQQSQLSTAEI